MLVGKIMNYRIHTIVRIPVDGVRSPSRESEYHNATNTFFSN